MKINNPPMDSVNVGDRLTMLGDGMPPAAVLMYVGQVLLVKAVDLPLVAIEVMTGPAKGQRGPMDLRACKWKKVSEEYHQALIGPFDKALENLTSQIKLTLRDMEEGEGDGLPY